MERIDDREERMNILIERLKSGEFMVDGHITSRAIYHYFNGDIYTQYEVLSEREFRKMFYDKAICFETFLPAKNTKRRALEKFHEETTPSNWVKYCQGFYPYNFFYTITDVWDLIQTSHSLITVITSKKDMDTGIVARLKNLYGNITIEDFNYDNPIYRTRTVLIYEVDKPVKIVDEPAIATLKRVGIRSYSIITDSELVFIVNGNSMSVIKNRKGEDFFIEYVK